MKTRLNEKYNYVTTEGKLPFTSKSYWYFPHFICVQVYILFIIKSHGFFWSYLVHKTQMSSIVIYHIRMSRVFLKEVILFF